MTDARATLIEETTRALDALGTVSASGSLLPLRATEPIERVRAEARRMLARKLPSVAIVGERRTGALLDAWLGTEIFTDLDATGDTPVLVIRAGDRASCRARLQNGDVEDFEVAHPAPAPAPAPAPPPPAPPQPVALVVPPPPEPWWRRLWLWILRRLGVSQGTVVKATQPDPQIQTPLNLEVSL